MIPARLMEKADSRDGAAPAHDFVLPCSQQHTGTNKVHEPAVTLHWNLL